MREHDDEEPDPERDAELERHLLNAHPDWQERDRVAWKRKGLPIYKILRDQETEFESDEPITEDHIAKKLSRLAFLPWAKTLDTPELRKDQIRCLEMLAKYLKMFVEKPREPAEAESLQKQMKSALSRMRKMNAEAQD